MIGLFPRVVLVLFNPVELFIVVMKAVIAQLVLNPKQHEESTGEAYGEPGNVYQGDSFLLHQDSEGLFQLNEGH